MWWKFQPPPGGAWRRPSSCSPFYARSLPFVEVLAPYDSDASATATSSTRRRSACTSSTTAASSGPFVYPLQVHASTWRRFRRDYTDDRSTAAAAPLLLPRRRLRVLGRDRRRTSTSSARRRTARCSCSAPTGSAATCFSRIIYGARISLTDRPRRHRRVSFTLGIVLRRPRRLLRRLGRQRRSSA